MFAAALTSLASTSPAFAGATGSAPDDITDIPLACRAYMAGAARDPVVAWNALLSFAGCVQDATIARIADPGELRAIVDRLYDALAPSIGLYLQAIEYGPPAVQLRAAYGAGMANIALVTRLRSSLVAPADRGDAAALGRYRALQDELEPLLIRARRTAWIAFAVVDRTAAGAPAAARDPVTRQVVAAARAMLAVFGSGRERVWPAPGTTEI